MEFMALRTTCKDHAEHCLRCLLKKNDHLDPAPAGEYCQYCGTCGEFATLRGKALKKCGGCGIAAYCSKECQKKDWKMLHKTSCRSKRTGARGPDGDAVEGSGFSSRMALFDTLSKWMRVHESTLMLMANTAASIYGINELLESRSRLLLITLCPHHDNRPFDGNPASGFEFINAHLVSREVLGAIVNDADIVFDQIMQAADKTTETTRKTMLDPGYVLGVLPILFAIRSCKFCHSAFYAINRRRKGIRPMRVERSMILNALMDLLILKIIGEGHVLNSLSISPMGGPFPILVGKMVQIKKKWKWEQIEWDWDTVFEESFSKTGSTMSWRKVLELEAWG